MMKLYYDSQSQESPASTDTVKTHPLPLPIPPTIPPYSNDILLTLISYYLQYSIISSSYIVFSSYAPATSDTYSPNGTSLLSIFAESLYKTNTLLQWIPHLAALPSEHMDSILTRAYTAITKSSVIAKCSSADAKPVFQIRVYALRLLLHTSSTVLLPSTFWGQTVKFAGIFVRDVVSGSPSAETKNDATQTVLSVFDQIVGLALATRAGEDRMRWLSGSGFMSFCDYWIEFARRVCTA